MAQKGVIPPTSTVKSEKGGIQREQDCAALGIRGETGGKWQNQQLRLLVKKWARSRVKSRNQKIGATKTNALDQAANVVTGERWRDLTSYEGRSGNKKGGCGRAGRGEGMIGSV